MQQLPTLEESIELLKTVSGLDEFDPDTPLRSSGVDSLNLVEWVYEMQERHPELGLDESKLDDIDDVVSFRQVHGEMVQAPGGVPAGPAADDVRSVRP